MVSIQDASIKPGTKVFVRCDLDVPLKNGKILETFRLDNCLETLKHILEKGGKPIIAGHIGRPKGEENESLSTTHLLPYFNGKLGKDTFELVENLRFEECEEENCEEFSKELSTLAEMYINECFATIHRPHASIIGVPQYLPSYAGFHLQKEMSTLTKILENPEKPFVIIIGGAKVEDKEHVASRFTNIADYILLAGKVALNWKNTNKPIPENLQLPTDYAQNQFDIGPETIQKYKSIINKAKTVIWAGPLGKYEDPTYFTGTKEIAQQIAWVTQKGCLSIIGGGDTITAANKAGIPNQISFVSTGGGALLRFLAGEKLVGIEALSGNKN